MKKLVFVFILILILFPLYSQDKKIITVLDFSVNNVSESDMASIVSFLSAALFDTGMFRVIDSSQRNAILEELSFSVSGCVDESCQLEIGKLLSAEMIVVGDIGYIGGRYILTAKLLETETSATVNTAKGIFTDIGELIDNINVFANELAGSGTGGAGNIVGTSADVISESSDKSSGSGLSTLKIIGISATAAGGLVTALGGYFFYDLVSFYNNTYKPAEEAYNSGKDNYPGDWATAAPDERKVFFDNLWEEYKDASDKKKSKIITSFAVSGGGLVMLGAGVVLLFIPEETEPAIDENVSFLFKPGISRTSFGLTLSY